MSSRQGGAVKDLHTAPAFDAAEQVYDEDIPF